MKILNYLLILSIGLFIVSCEEGTDNPDGNEPVILTGEISSPLILEDRFEGITLPDYLITGSLVLNAGVTIEPGVNIIMDPEASIRVRIDGFLKAVGLENNPIVIQGKSNISGYWDEITFDNSNNNNNIFERVIISDGGGGTFSSGMIEIKGSSKVNFTSTLIDNSGSYGIYIVNEESSLPNFSGNIISNCINLPIRLYTSQFHFIDGATQYLNNGNNNYIEVEGNGLYQDVTWKKLPVAALLMGPYNNIHGDLTVEAGSRFVMGADAKLNVESTGSMHLGGTPTQRISFTGDVQSPGYFESVTFEDSNNPLNALHYVDISYGGSGFDVANLWLSGGSRVEIIGCSFNYSAGYGVYVSRYSTLIDMGGNTYTGNTSVDTYYQQ
ncbi:MAG: hypothetical protein LC649_07375 [Bacteroidales bacterium]|nr:hypothetical protein [Bacteroidales bacterium]